MARAVIAIYESFYTANQAVQELHNTGFPYDWMNIWAHSGRNNAAEPETEFMPDSIAPEIHINGQETGAQIGAGVGAAVGLMLGLLAAIGEVQLPGLAAGLQTALMMAGASMIVWAGAGGLLGSLAGMGVPEHEIRQYAKSIHQGDVMLVVLAHYNTVEPVIEILNRHYPLEVKEKTTVRRNMRPADYFSDGSHSPSETRKRQD